MAQATDPPAPLTPSASDAPQGVCPLPPNSDSENASRDKLSAAATRAAVRHKLITLLSRPRWRAFVPARYGAQAWSQLSSAVTKTYTEYTAAKSANTPYHFHPSHFTKHMPKRLDLIRNFAAPFVVNAISSVALFEVFEQQLALQEPQWATADCINKGEVQLAYEQVVHPVVHVGAVAGLVYGTINWPMERFLLTVNGMTADRVLKVWRAMPVAGHLSDYSLTALRDSLGFACFFGVYAKSKEVSMEALGEVGARPEKGDLRWPHGELHNRLLSTGVAGVSAGVAFGVVTQPLEYVRHGVYRQFHESYQRIPRAPEEAASFQAPTVASLASLLRKFCGRVLRAAPANAVSITIYELMKITMADPDIKSD